MSIIDSLPEIKGKYRENADVGKMCWFKTSAIAEILFIPQDIEDLEYFLLNKPRDLPVYIMGAGSNLLIRDGGIKGVMIRLGSGFNYIEHEDNDIMVGGACSDLNLATYVTKNSIAGLEFFAGIPGSIGGALAMNAGAYNNDISSVLVETKAISMLTGEMKAFQNREIGYRYRGKNLSDEWIFYEAKLRGQKGDKAEILKVIGNIQKQRSSTQPIKSKTGGSTFKNPSNHKAWQLIDQCGLRGMRQGDAKFSELHCNFLVNEGNAKTSDLEFLIETAKERVKEKFNIDLEKEIKIIG